MLFEAQKMPKLPTNPLTSARRQMDLSVVSEAFFRPEKAEAASVYAGDALCTGMEMQFYPVLHINVT